MGNFVPLPGHPYGSKDPLPHGDVNAASEALVKAHNADEGSSHAPTGDSGWSGSMGFGWTFADSFPFTGEVSVDGAGLTIGAAASGFVSFGALVAVDIFGPTTFKNGGASLVQWESSATATFLSGSTFTLASGATANLTGSTLVRGTLTIKASGGPGSLVIEAGTTNPFAGLIQLLSTSELRFTSGSKLTGTIEVSGGTSSITLKDGMTLTAEAGAAGNWTGTWIFKGTSVTVGDGLDITLSPARSWTRRGYRVAATSYSAGNASTIDNAFSSVYTSTPTILLNGGISSITQKAIIEIEPPPDGATAVSVSVKCQGLTSEAITATPTYRLVRWQGSLTGATSNMSAIATDVHDGTAPNWVTTETTTFVVTANATIDTGYRYGVLITFPVNSTGDTSMAEVDIELTGTTTKITGK